MDDVARYRRIEELYHAAAALSPAQRRAWLVERCDGDLALVREVEALLDDAGDAVDLAAADAATLIDSDEQPMPATVGPFRILGLIGEGGMGRVYEAEQDEPRRRVALKLIRPGLMSREGLRRFRHEADVLASLHHPGIAQVLQAGNVVVADAAGIGVSQPYIAMELVRGVPITEYARRRGIDIRLRLELLARVCDAVQHAHQRGVIHRDLKPANILVEDEPRGVDHDPPAPKILDFGIARLTAAGEPGTAAPTLLTTSPGQIVGTLAYMSPEQVDGDPRTLDTRADVYALGVIGYELLGGRLPLDVGSRSIAAAVAMIRTQEPTRLGTIDRALRGDVETIIHKAMDKDRDRRYGSAGEVAADIRRWARSEPIAARPAGALYQIGKFARRNRLLVGAAALAVVALAAGAAVATVSAVREARARQRADIAAHRANLSAALADIKGGNASSARQRLAEVDPDQRSWEWRYLNRQCDSSVATLELPANVEPALLPGPVEPGLEHRPPGLLLFPVEGGPGHLWQPGAAPELRPIFDVGPQPTRAEVSPDGRTLLVARGEELTARNLADMSGAVLWRREAPHRLGSSAFSPDGGCIAVEASEGEIALLSPTDGRELRRLALGAGSGKVPRFAPPWENMDAQQARRLLISGSYHTDVLDSADGRRLGRFGLWESVLVRGGRLVVGLRQSDLAMADVETGEIQSIDLVGPSRRMAVDPAGRIALIPDMSAAIRARTLRDGRTYWMHGHARHAGRLEVSADGRWALTRSDREFKWWDLHALGEHREVGRAYETIFSATVSPDGRLLTTLGWGSVRTWDTATGAMLWTRVISSREGPARASYAPDGRSVLVAGFEGFAVAYDARTGERRWQAALLDGSVRSVAWLGGEGPSRRVAIGDAEGRIWVLDASSGTESARLDVRQPVLGLAAAPTAPGRILALLGSIPADSTPPCLAELSRLESGGLSRRNLVTLKPGPERAAALAVSADGRWVLASREPVDAVLLDLRHGRDWRIPGDLGAGVLGAAFSPDGRRMVLLCSDGLVRMFDPAAREETLSLTPACGVPCSAWLGHDRLIVSGNYKPLVIFDAAPRPEDTLRWRRADDARELVEHLFEELLFADRVVERVRTMPGLSDVQRTWAEAQARGRGDHYNQLNSRAWDIVRYPGRPRDEIRSALEMAEVCCRGVPDRFQYANTLGVGYYRAGRHAEALDCFARSTALRAGIGRPPHPLDAVFTALALRALGRMDEARRAWAQAEALMGSDPRNAGDQELLSARKEWLDADRSP